MRRAHPVQPWTIVGAALRRMAAAIRCLCWSVAYRPPDTPAKARIPPFESIEIDLGYLFGEPQ